MKRILASALLTGVILLSASNNFSMAVNDFGIELYRKIPSGKNKLVSPVSVYAALSMTIPGADGETRAQLVKAMSCGTNDDLATGIQDNFKNLTTNSSIKMVNAAWFQKKYFIKNEFSDLLKKYWQTAFYPADFIKNFDRHRQEINLFTEKNTDGKVKNILSQGSLDHQTRLVLLNALYFKDQWATGFDRTKTYKADFNGNSGKRKTSFMLNKSEYAYCEMDGFSALEIPYKEQNFSMIIVLPSETKKIEDVIKSLDAKSVISICENLNKRPVELHLPKFSFTNSYELKKTLKLMGIENAFSMQADFSGIEPTKELYISKVVHGTGIEVDENGTVASAATAVVVSRKGLPPPPVVFKADKPFFFMIRHNETGLLIFVGEVSI